MSSPASIGKHPIHPMLVAFPIGLWVFSFVCDVIRVLFNGDPVWSVVALYCIAGGIVGALLAAVPGFIDYLSITSPSAKRIATYHMLLNLAAVVLFAVNFWLRIMGTVAYTVPVILSFLTIVAVGISGWFGGELVYVHRMGVEDASPTSSPNLRKTG